MGITKALVDYSLRKQRSLSEIKRDIPLNISAIGTGIFFALLERVVASLGEYFATTFAREIVGLVAGVTDVIML